MKTKIKHWGSSNVIILDKNVMEYKNLKVGDWVDVSEITKAEDPFTTIKAAIKRLRKRC